MAQNVNSTVNVSSSSEEVDPLTRMMKLIEETASNKEDDYIVAPTSSVGEKLPEETKIRRLRLYRAALNGDWEVAKHIYDDCEENIGVEITKRGDTALHIAAAAKHVDFVKELVKRMTENDLIGKQNKVGSTALFFAAASGKVELAKVMMKTNKAIAMVPDISGTLPIDMAASLGHKDMVEYLYQETRHSLNEERHEKLFITCIKTDLYDVALQLLTSNPDHLATARAENGETALHILSRKRPTFSDFANQKQREIFQRCFKLVSGCKVGETKRQQALQLVERIWRKIVLLSDHELSQLITEPRKLIFDAAERGNVEFLSILIREYPDLIWKVDNKENKYTIFHIAVKNRQEDVFKLIYEIGSSKEILLMSKDKKGNNILHLAELLASQDRLNTIPGEALQLQRELVWFKQVEKLVQQGYVEARNADGLTPKELFREEHRDLREKGEKWMKETAESCTVVAALIATVAFAAAITVPGANNQDTGFPVFIQKVSFQVFAISDAISLVFSLTSIATFLNILTSRYAEEDFLWNLPSKLHIGMFSLFVSLVALLVVFSTTFFIFFNRSRLWIAILVAIIAPTPVNMFMVHNVFHILADLLYSDFLVHQAKNSLFRREWEASDLGQKGKKNSAQLKFHCSCSTNV